MLKGMKWEYFKWNLQKVDYNFENNTVNFKQNQIDCFFYVTSSSDQAYSSCKLIVKKYIQNNIEVHKWILICVMGALLAFAVQGGVKFEAVKFQPVV